jgi:hypothetical protein
LVENEGCGKFSSVEPKPWLHYFFPLVLTKLIFRIFFTSLNIFLQEGCSCTNLGEGDTREVLWLLDIHKVKNYSLNKKLLP